MFRSEEYGGTRVPFQSLVGTPRARMSFPKCSSKNTLPWSSIFHKPHLVEIGVTFENRRNHFPEPSRIVQQSLCNHLILDQLFYAWTLHTSQALKVKRDLLGHEMLILRLPNTPVLHIQARCTVTFTFKGPTKSCMHILILIVSCGQPRSLDFFTQTVHKL